MASIMSTFHKIESSEETTLNDKNKKSPQDQDAGKTVGHFFLN